MSIRTSACNADHSSALIRYVYQPLQQSQIRILTLYPGEESDELRIHLRHVRLPPYHSNFDSSCESDDSVLVYEALSYTWGTASTEKHVLVESNVGGGHDSPCAGIFVTDNLAEAMRRLRDTESARALWIDAICINQQDDDERSKQVPLMAQIFKSAARVLVWLGPERDDSALAMRLIEFMSTRVKFDWSTYEHEFDANYYTDFQTEFNVEFTASAFAAPIESLLEREWFKRVWVRQEISLARQAVVFCGASEITWNLFKIAALGLIYKLFGIRRATNLFFFVRSSPKQWREVREMLAGTRCTDLRDRVYGILAIVDDEDAGLPDVDYSLSVAEVYTATTAHYFQKARFLDLLRSCELAPDRMPELPSWVPDFSTSPSSKEFHSNAFLATDTVPSVEFPQGPSGGAIRLPGIKKSSLKAVEAMGSLRSEAAEAVSRILRMGPAIDEVYVGGNETFNDALCEALECGDYHHTFVSFPAATPTFEEARCASRGLVSLVASMPFIGMAAGNTIGRGSSSPRETAQYEHFGTNISRMWRGRALFLTEDGFVGLGPLWASPGDSLFFPWGSRFPVLMRPANTTSESIAEEAQQQWLVVGPCYVSGLMSGEILYGPFPPDCYIISFMTGENRRVRPEIHKMNIQGNQVVGTERNVEYERERVRKTFGVDDVKLVTPEMAICKGIPITWVDFV